MLQVGWHVLVQQHTTHAFVAQPHLQSNVVMSASWEAHQEFVTLLLHMLHRKQQDHLFNYSWLYVQC